MTAELVTRVDFSLTPEQEKPLENAISDLRNVALDTLIPAHKNCVAQLPSRVEVSETGFREHGTVSLFLKATAACPGFTRKQCYTSYNFDSKTRQWVLRD